MSSASRNYLPQFVLLVLVLAAVFSGCSKPQRTAKTDFDIIMGGLSDSGDFRGISIGKTRAEVKAAEELQLKSEKEDELIYRAPLDTTSKAFFQVMYHFDQYGLFEIQADIFPADTSRATRIYSKFKNLFDQRYGKSKGDNKYATWRTVSQANKEVDVTLNNESQEAGRAYISINFFEPLDNEY